MTVPNLIFGKLFSSDRLDEAVRIVEKLAQRDFDVSIDSERRDRYAPLMQALDKLRKSLVQDQRQLAALDVVTANVMIADADLNVVYMNQYGRRLMEESEADLRKVLPHFTARNLIGVNIDSFHKNPSHQRNLLANLNSSYHTRIEVGPRKFALTANPLRDDKGKRLGTVVEWNDRTVFDEVEKRTHILETALETVSTSIMVADPDRRITYMNPSATSMFKDLEPRLRTLYPGFSADRLLGSSIDQFHSDPGHQGELLAAQNSSITTKLSLGSLSLELTANPIVDAKGQRLGTAVEWFDRTPQDSFDQEITKMIGGVMKGRLNSRMNVEAIPLPHGVYRKTAEGVNLILDAVINPLNVASNYVDRIAHGDVPPKITDKYHGDFDTFKNNLNTCIDAINALIDDAGMLAQAAVDGRIQTRADAGRHQGDFRRIIEGVNNTLDTLLAPIIAIKQVTDSINTAAKEIAMGNSDLSQRTEEQASSLEETASSMEELASTVRQNADNARQANQMAVAASDVAKRGGDVVQRVVGTMHDINESSRKIVDIISVIDGIAFQTNILALNAAVEAARAGEQGRGFAVVAGEVRNLAQRSAAAAKEIKALINNSVDKVDDGAKLVEEAGRTMDEIVTSVRRVTDIMAEIAAASVEQSSGIEQVNQAITQMDDVTQQNAALVEQAAAAAESLEEQATALAENVAQFHLEGYSELPPARPQASRHALPSQARFATPKKPTAGKPLKVPPIASDDEWTEF
ncbi:methyl-accepting chemotaxis protein [Methylococcus sp. EFPC2]|uniref:methyl-accepting chemotaxis protein n=1 Tax=Methylococcus sp. EFPC2 TaxID=2812648 RepID=UPI001968598E|nr:methyl-accepting chemotaxis protein [Methylococcus sp. EFPC2]QSA96542.1 PAS domain-containing protein [Methylococcus sp. EFPC2]